MLNRLRLSKNTSKLKRTRRGRCQSIMLCIGSYIPVKAGKVIVTAAIGISQEITFYLVMYRGPFTISDKMC